MRGKRGDRRPWSTYYRSREQQWAVKFYGPDGVRREQRIPREHASRPHDKAKADRYAESWYAVFEEEVRRGTASVASPEAPVAKVALLGDFFEKWLELRKQALAAGRIRGATLKQDRGMLNEHIRPALGEVPLSELTSGRLRPFSETCRRGWHRTPSTTS
jgi:hypothetical protein